MDVSFFFVLPYLIRLRVNCFSLDSSGQHGIQLRMRNKALVKPIIFLPRLNSVQWADIRHACDKWHALYMQITYVLLSIMSIYTRIYIYIYIVYIITVAIFTILEQEWWWRTDRTTQSINKWARKKSTNMKTKKWDEKRRHGKNDWKAERTKSICI